MAISRAQAGRLVSSYHDGPSRMRFQGTLEDEKDWRALVPGSSVLYLADGTTVLVDSAATFPNWTGYADVKSTPTSTGVWMTKDRSVSADELAKGRKALEREEMAKSKFTAPQQAAQDAVAKGASDAASKAAEIASSAASGVGDLLLKVAIAYFVIEALKSSALSWSK